MAPRQVLSTSRCSRCTESYIWTRRQAFLKPITERTLGRRGGIILGSDRTGALRVRLQLDVQQRSASISFQFTTPTDAFPEDVRPILDVLNALRAPNVIVIYEVNTGASFGATPAPDEGFIEDGYVELISALARIQRETRVRFPIPDVFSPEDQEQMARAIHLLDGKEIDMTWDRVGVESTGAGVDAMKEKVDFRGQQQI